MKISLAGHHYQLQLHYNCTWCKVARSLPIARRALRALDSCSYLLLLTCSILLMFLNLPHVVSQSSERACGIHSSPMRLGANQVQQQVPDTITFGACAAWPWNQTLTRCAVSPFWVPRVTQSVENDGWWVSRIRGKTLCIGGLFFQHFFLASGFWLLASGSFGFWLLACICCILEPKSLICVLFAAVWSQFACPFGFWLLAFGFGFTWLLAFGFWFLLFFGLWFHLAFGFWPHFCWMYV